MDTAVGCKSCFANFSRFQEARPMLAGSEVRMLDIVHSSCDTEAGLDIHGVQGHDCLSNHDKWNCGKHVNQAKGFHWLHDRLFSLSPGSGPISVGFSGDPSLIP